MSGSRREAKSAETLARAEEGGSCPSEGGRATIPNRATSANAGATRYSTGKEPARRRNAGEKPAIPGSRAKKGGDAVRNRG